MTFRTLLIDDKTKPPWDARHRASQCSRRYNKLRWTRETIYRINGRRLPKVYFTVSSCFRSGYNNYVIRALEATEFLRSHKKMDIYIYRIYNIYLLEDEFLWSAPHKALCGKRYKVEITKREYFRIESENRFIPTECEKNIYYFYTKKYWDFSNTWY